MRKKSKRSPVWIFPKSEVWNRTKQQIIDLQEEFGHVETYVNLMGIQNIAMDLMGQNVLMAYYSAPDEVQELFRKIQI